MGLRSSILLQEEDIAEIERETGFSSNQITRLYNRFSNLDKTNKGTLSHDDLMRIPELAINPLGDRIVASFFDTGDNKQAGAECNFKQFVRTLAHFRPEDRTNTGHPLNSRKQKLKFIFKIYDIDDDGVISKEDLMQILHMMVGMSINDYQLAAIADRAIHDADANEDEKISFEELEKVMQNVDLNAKMSIRFLA